MDTEKEDKEDLEVDQDETEDDVDDESEDAEQDDEPADTTGLKRPSAIKAIKAKCYECCGDMLDGRIDCRITTCSLYWWQPYRKKLPDLSWQTTGSHIMANRTARRAAMKERARAHRDALKAEEEEN